MADFDLLYLDDDPEIREDMEYWLGKSNLTYQMCGSLSELKEALNHDYKIYSVDGRFPEEPGDAIEVNFPKAAEMIRQKNPDAKIILYSAEMNAREIAEKYNATLFDKGTTDLEEAAKKLENMIK